MNIYPMLIILILFLLSPSLTGDYVYYKIMYSIPHNSAFTEKELFAKFYIEQKTLSINNTLYNTTVLYLKELNLKIPIVLNRTPVCYIKGYKIYMGDDYMASFDVDYSNIQTKKYSIDLYYECHSGILVEAVIFSKVEEGTEIGSILLYNYTKPLEQIQWNKIISTISEDYINTLARSNTSSHLTTINNLNSNGVKRGIPIYIIGLSIALLALLVTIIVVKYK